MSLKKQIIINSFGSIMLLGCQWLISILIVRLSGFEDAGVFALAMSIANVFATVMNYGIRNYQVTDISFQYAPNYYVYARLFLIIFAGLLCIIYLFIDHYSPKNTIAILLYLSYNASFNISDIIMGNIQRAEHLEINGYSNTIRGISCLALFGVVQYLNQDLLMAMGAMSLGSLLVLFFFDIPLYLKTCQERGDLTKGVYKTIFSIYRICFFIFISTVIPILITAIPRREIQLILGETMLGFFSSVYTPAVVLNTLIPSMIIAIVPSISKKWKEGNNQGLKREIRTSYLLVISITFLAFVVSVLCGKPFLKMLYGSDILPYTTLLQTAIVAIGLNCACVCGSYIMISLEQRWLMALFSIISLCIVLIASRPFIMKCHIYGAAYVLIAGYGVQIILQLFTIHFNLKENKT